VTPVGEKTGPATSAPPPPSTDLKQEILSAAASDPLQQRNAGTEDTPNNPSSTETMTSTSKLPPATSLPSLPEKDIEDILDKLFEPSKTLHRLVVPAVKAQNGGITGRRGIETGTNPDVPGDSEKDLFSTYDSLIDYVGKQVNALSMLGSLGEFSSSAKPEQSDDQKALYSILGAHPRLGAKKAAAESLSDSSKSEQAGFGEGSEAELLKGLNEEYESKFPGLRYVVFVNGRPRTEIMQNMKTRIERGDFEAEVQEGIEAMCDIAKDRASKLGGD
jgi:OHCU decarboxylase